MKAGRTRLKELKEESAQLLFAFLKSEVRLGLTFARLAEYERDTANVKHYEQSKRHAIVAAETIERFKERLPADAQREIETHALELMRIISTL